MLVPYNCCVYWHTTSILGCNLTMCEYDHKREGYLLCDGWRMQCIGNFCLTGDSKLPPIFSHPRRITRFRGV